MLNKGDLRFILYFAVALLLQLTLVKYIQIYNWRPDLLLIVLVAFALQKGPNIGMTAGFLVGLVQDILSTQYLGLTALSKTVAGFLAGSLRGKFAARTEFLLTLFICGLMHDLIYFFINTLGENFSFQSLVVLYTIPNLTYTIIIGVVFSYFVDVQVSEERVI
ncbi:MAG: rod shape-determining protein MreD [Calditrichia bacterium]